MPIGLPLILPIPTIDSTKNSTFSPHHSVLYCTVLPIIPKSLLVSSSNCSSYDVGSVCFHGKCIDKNI